MTRYLRFTAEERAELDALRAIAIDVPDPRGYARSLETGAPALGQMLIDAYRASDAENRGCWRVDRDTARFLRPLGLVEVGGPHLTVFGINVRKALLAEDDA